MSISFCQISLRRAFSITAANSVSSERTHKTVCPEHETHLLIAVTISQWQFYKREITQTLAQSDFSVQKTNMENDRRRQLAVLVYRHSCCCRSQTSCSSFSEFHLTCGAVLFVFTAVFSNCDSLQHPPADTSQSALPHWLCWTSVGGRPTRLMRLRLDREH